MIQPILKGKTLKQQKASKKKEDKDKLSVWREEVFRRAGYKCEYCGKEGRAYLNPHHVYSRADYKLRYDPDNGIALCPKHHTLGSDFSAHLTPMDFTEWIINYRGKKWHKKLQTKHWNNGL